MKDIVTAFADYLVEQLPGVELNTIEEVLTWQPRDDCFRLTIDDMGAEVHVYFYEGQVCVTGERNFDVNDPDSVNTITKTVMAYLGKEES